MDGVQKIRKEVVRLQKRAEHNFDISLTENEKQFWLGESNVLTLIGKYIDSLQEEPVSEDLDIAIGEYCSNPDNFITYIDVAFAYRSEQKDDIPLIIKAIKFGANWQKDKFTALLNAEKDKTSIGLNEWENGIEHGRMKVINSLTKKLEEL